MPRSTNCSSRHWRPGTAFSQLRSGDTAQQPMAPNRPASGIESVLAHPHHLLSLEDFAAKIGVPAEAIDDLARKLELKVVPLGGICYVHEAQANAAIAACFHLVGGLLNGGAATGAVPSADGV